MSHTWRLDRRRIHPHMFARSNACRSCWSRPLYRGPDRRVSDSTNLHISHSAPLYHLPSELEYMQTCRPSSSPWIHADRLWALYPWRTIWLRALKIFIVYLLMTNITGGFELHIHSKSTEPSGFFSRLGSFSKNGAHDMMMAVIERENRSDCSDCKWSLVNCEEQ
jgi:hypothetical protein